MEVSNKFKSTLIAVFDCFHVYDLRQAEMELYHQKGFNKMDRNFLLECLNEAKKLKQDRLTQYKEEPTIKSLSFNYIKR